MRCIVEQQLHVGIRGAESFKDLLATLVYEDKGEYLNLETLNIKLSDLPDGKGVRATWNNSYANFYEDTPANRALLGLELVSNPL